MDASAIMQNDATLENLRAMTDATREYGVYRSPSSPSPPAGRLIRYARPARHGRQRRVPAPACASLGREAEGTAADLRRPVIPSRIWNDVEGLAYLYIWHVLLSF